jgi:hypothetical protein
MLGKLYWTIVCFCARPYVRVTLEVTFALCLVVAEMITLNRIG